MKTRVLVLAGVAAIGLSACNNSSQDTVNNAELNQPASDLNALSNDAATDASNEAAPLGNQQAELNAENAAAEDNTANPSDAQEQNVDAM